MRKEIRSSQFSIIMRGERGTCPGNFSPPLVDGGGKIPPSLVLFRISFIRPQTETVLLRVGLF